MSWYKVTLPFEEEGVRGACKTLKDRFEGIFMAKRGPKGAALFTSHNEKFDHRFYYFSPDASKIAASLIESFEGVECPPPAMRDVVLLVGNADTLEALLQDKENS